MEIIKFDVHNNAMYYKKDIQKDDYTNPYHKKSPQLNKNFVLFSIFLIVAGYWIYLIVYSPYFKIKRVFINDLEYVDRKKVEDIINASLAGKKFFIFPRDNYFFFNTDILAKKIKKDFLIDGANVAIEEINNLDVIIKEKPSSITWITGDRYYYLDMDGNVKKEIMASDADRNYHIIYDGENKELPSPQNHPKVIEKKYIEQSLKIINDIKEHTNFEIISSKYFSNAKQELYGKTNKGFEIYFDLSGNIDEQLNNLYILLKGKINDADFPKEYIDLRFGEKVYEK